MKLVHLCGKKERTYGAMKNTKREERFERRMKNLISELKEKKRKRKKLSIAVVLIVSIAVFMSISTSSLGAPEKQYEVIVVRSGDTLWDIAKEHSGNKNISKSIYEIKKINNLSSASDLQPGMELNIPII